MSSHHVNRPCQVIKLIYNDINRSRQAIIFSIVKYSSESHSAGIVNDILYNIKLLYKHQHSLPIHILNIFY